MSARSLAALTAAYPGLIRLDRTKSENGLSPITSIVLDSREVKPGAMFFAIPGDHTDGHEYISRAARAGAAAIICEYENDQLRELMQSSSCPAIFQADNSRYALSAISAAFYGYPGDELIVIGVTGTDGKSSSVSYLHQLIESLGFSCGFTSTVSMQTGSEATDNNLRQSTPEAPQVHQLLREMADAGKKVAIVESTSHGLSEKTARLRDVNYNAALFTNITHEHLEFHGSFEQYLADKSSLFSRLQPIKHSVLEAAGLSVDKDSHNKEHNKEHNAAETRPPVAVINYRDENWRSFYQAAESAGAQINLYQACQSGEMSESIGSGMNPGDAPAPAPLFTVENCMSHADYSVFDLHFAAQQDSPPQVLQAVRLPVPGSFNIDNMLACATLVYQLFHAQPEAIRAGIEQIRGVRGRMLPLFHGQDFSAIVDYAHSPGSFRVVFPMFRSSCKGRLIAVFGSAGERDVEKRPIQGEIAAEYADILIITDEDPRLEDSMTIIEQIAEGARASGHTCQIECISDRKSAIRRAMEIAGKDDLIVMLGKGHEGSIIMADGKHDWDEERVAREILEDMGYTRKDT